MKELAITDFKRKYPGEYGEFLTRLGVPVFNDRTLKMSGIKTVRVYSIKGKRYYSSRLDCRLTHAGRREFLGDDANDKSYECFIVTLSRCDIDPEVSGRKYETGLIGGECVEYILRIKNRKASFVLYIADNNVLPPNLVLILLHIIEKQINIDVTIISVHAEDKPLLKKLQAAGFTISVENGNHYSAVKSLI